MKLLYDVYTESFFMGWHRIPEIIAEQLGDKVPYNEMKRIMNGDFFQNKKVVSDLENFLKKNNLKDYDGIKIIEVPDAHYSLIGNKLYTSDSPITKAEGSDFENGA